MHTSLSLASRNEARDVACGRSSCLASSNNVDKARDDMKGNRACMQLGRATFLAGSILIYEIALTCTINACRVTTTNIAAATSVQQNAFCSLQRAEATKGSDARLAVARKQTYIRQHVKLSDGSATIAYQCFSDAPTSTYTIVNNVALSMSELLTKPTPQYPQCS